MPRTTRRPSLVRGRVARTTRLDSCGRFVYGEYNQAVTDGIITVTFTANTNTTDEISVVKMDGKRCVYEPSLPELSGYSIDVQFCAVEPDIFEMITGQTLVFDAQGRAVGIEMDTRIKLDDKGFGFELWAGASGGDACEDAEAEGEFGYILLPRLQGGVLGDFTVENGAISFTITGAATRDGNQWGNGPYNVDRDTSGKPAPLFQALSTTAALRIQAVTVSPPEPFVGSRPLLNPTLPKFTSISAVEGSTKMEAGFTVTPPATGSTWWDFGDGEWDYVVAPGAASHTYDKPGTYVARASQNGNDWTERSVTVPFA